MMTNNAVIGWEFELFPNTTIENVKYNLEKILKKEIRIFNEGHAKFTPTKDIYKLERDYSGGKRMVELVTAPERYDVAMGTLRKVLEFIRYNGYTTSRSAIQPNISFEGENITHKFNKLKFILGFNEDYVYEGFESRKNALYSKSIKHIIPSNKFLVENISSFNSYDYRMPESKYYGVNFDKLKNGYLEFRYLGGKDYEYKEDLIKEKINYFIDSMKRCNTFILDEQEQKILINLTNNKKSILEAYKSLRSFKRVFPNIKLCANLIETDSYVEMYYESMMRDKVIDLIVNNDIKQGVINYNSDYRSFELKDVKIENCFELKNVDLVSCEINNGLLEQCMIFDTKINNSNITACQIYQESKVDGCKLNDCYVSSGSDLNECYIAGNNKYSIVLGSIKNSVFRSGTISKLALDEARNVEFISYTLLKDYDKKRSSYSDKDGGIDNKDNIK